MYNQGCRAAHGAPGLIILDWGQPVYLGNNTYGTYDFGGHLDSDTAILHAVANFAQGVWSCRTGSTNIAIGIGQSNYYSGNSIPLTTAAWYADGQQWGNLVNTVQSFISNNHYTVVGSNGAGDLEVEWETFALTSSLVNGYNSVTRHAYFDFGDDSPGWWSNYQVWYVAYGATDNFPLPEIYYNADATYDWEPLAVRACRYEGGPINFKGTMSENASGTNSPGQAFIDMYNAEASNSCTARAPRLQWRWVIPVFTLLIAAVTVVVFAHTLTNGQQQGAAGESAIQAGNTYATLLTPVSTPDAQPTTRVGVFSISSGGPIPVPA